ncbi:hypothetical protein SJI00_12960 [Pseudomonas sp. RP23018S]|uniref:hypothetical protein n=1 Tax=Pseudomonas sp. RP23018S TaxID=3096037 RepID=UPI002ACAD1D0|nr:hypothetical protein [Pseudomonas sp. RP23018S]MDZ5603685.1 hypothetical protein [Pseudomonas sp. RP23018S]
MNEPESVLNPKALRAITEPLPAAPRRGLRGAPGTQCEGLESHLLDAENNDAENPV